ncbi:hypothetical protein [Mesorhizobium sp. B1-1-8]|uniref:hypothetical protein n=1 Tax=Mesorhizobium sp. B1-1-8 TaxID=2589976 RepID=UPI00116C3B99|nr:hypothetical protein [Mesorhizobium sp. B1-1-8]UCI09143.1 hypothetical protein FJ974_08795 [Mesorhizobium sp. B1-1-8]
MFSADFVEKHWLGEEIDINRFSVLGGAFTRGSLEADARRTDLQGWTCDDFNVLGSWRQGWFKARLPANRPAIMRHQAFGGFGFSAAIKAAIAAAGEYRFSRPAAALHLRSGDIVYGTYRSRLEFGEKVIPAPLARQIVSKLASKGLATLLIGQDRAMLDYLKSETGALLSEDFGVNEFTDQTSRAFFEMGLMARCRQIYAGSSVFATIASVMGNVPVFRTKALFNQGRTAHIILEELRIREADYRPMEAAFGYQRAFCLLENRISPARARGILEKALALDLENRVYILKIVASHFREKNYAAGEAMLRAFMTREFDASGKIPTGIMQLLISRSWRGLVMSGDFGLYLAAARAGCAYAAACAAHILHAALGRTEAALAMAALSLKADPGNKLFQENEFVIRSGTSAKSSQA